MDEWIGQSWFVPTQHATGKTPLLRYLLAAQSCQHKKNLHTKNDVVYCKLFVNSVTDELPQI